MPPGFTLHAFHPKALNCFFPDGYREKLAGLLAKGLLQRLPVLKTVVKIEASLVSPSSGGVWGGLFTAPGIAPDFNRIPILIPGFNPGTNYDANVKAIKLEFKK